MKKPINWRNLQTPGLLVQWVCVGGHKEEDTTPLDKFAYCRQCETTYFWDEVEQRGPLKQLPRVSAKEAVSYER